MKDFKYSDITGKTIGCAMKVHSTLGNGFQEVIYQRCLEIEFRKQGVGYAREVSMPVHYESFEVGTRRVDFLIEDKIMLEIKAQTELTNIHYAQIINYLEAYGLEVGLLINFKQKSLKFKRFINSNKR